MESVGAGVCGVAVRAGDLPAPSPTAPPGHQDPRCAICCVEWSVACYPPCGASFVVCLRRVALQGRTAGHPLSLSLPCNTFSALESSQRGSEESSGVNCFHFCRNVLAWELVSSKTVCV